MIPLIDVSALRAGDPDARAEVAQQIDEACTKIGFFAIVGHGISPALIARTRVAAIEFFARPTQEKLAVERPPEKISRGYFKLGDRSIAYSTGKAAPPDIQEAFAFGPENDGPSATGPGAAMLAPNRWPAMAGFRDTMLAYRAEMVGLGQLVLGAMETALGLRDGFFADKFDREPSVVRLIRYPALTEPPVPGQLRSGAHTDYGTITFVRGDDTPGGLQVRTLDGGWLDVHPPADSFVCNIGDLMARWSNDRFVSTMHRVAVPPDVGASVDRISLVFFQIPNRDAVIAALQGDAVYPPITCAEHYLGKLMKASHVRLDAGAKDAARV